MTNSSLLMAILDQSLREFGFKKKSSSWYRSSNDVVQVVNLQRSQYGNQYYFNCGIGIKGLGLPDFPKEQQCHIRFRAASVVPDETRSKIEAIFDLDNDDFLDDERSREALSLVEEVLLPILNRCSSKNGIIDSIKNGVFVRAMIHKDIKDLII